MEFDLQKSLEILERTPKVLAELLRGLSDDWTKHNEGGETWSPFDVMGHLIHGEETDWIARLEICLEQKDDKTFTPFDRFAQFEKSKGKNLEQLLNEFAALRKRNLNILTQKNIQPSQLDNRAIHPALGEVTLRQLLSTWVVHDLNHIGQVVRVMAFQYKGGVGPWQEYLRILK